jgi:hypothetical protein
MTVREMHIEVNQSLQKVAANLTRKYLSPEIDWVLNKIQNRFIQQSLRPVSLADPSLQKFRFADQIRTDAMKNLTVTGKNIDAWEIPTYSDRVACFLPADYLYLMADVSNMYDLCGSTQVTNSNKTWYKTLELSQSPLTSGPYYTSNNSITVGTTTINIPGDLPTFNSYSGFNKKEDVVFLKDYIVYKFRELGVPVYWERYGNIYKPNKFIIPIGYNPTTAPSYTVSLQWDGTSVTNSAIEYISINELSLPPSRTTSIYTTDNRLTSNYDISSIYTPYYGPSIKSPVSELSDHVLYVYHDNNTIVKSVTISYIRKPRPISLSLGLDCEISSAFHQTICDLTVEYIKGQQEDAQGTEIKKQDNNTRVII